MIPKIIHRVYFDIGLGALESNAIFINSINKANELMPDYKQIVWSKKDVENLLEKKCKALLPFWNELRYEIQRIDLARFIILYFYGGFFVDLDLIPIKSFDALIHFKLLTYKPIYRKSVVGIDKKCKIGFDFWGCEPSNPIWLYILKECKKNYNLKKNMTIYDIWKARFVLQTTGPYFLNRVLNDWKHKSDIHVLPIVYDTKHDSNNNKDGFFLLQYMTGTWLNDDFYGKKKYEKNRFRTSKT